MSLAGPVKTVSWCGRSWLASQPPLALTSLLCFRKSGPVWPLVQAQALPVPSDWLAPPRDHFCSLFSLLLPPFPECDISGRRGGGGGSHSMVWGDLQAGWDLRFSKRIQAAGGGLSLQDPVLLCAWWFPLSARPPVLMTQDSFSSSRRLSLSMVASRASSSFSFLSFRRRWPRLQGARASTRGWASWTFLL